MGILISLYFISSSVISLKLMLLAQVSNKKEVQAPLVQRQSQQNSEDLVKPSKRLQTTEPPRKREYSPTPEEILLATLPDKREIKNPVLLTQRKPKSEKPGWPSKRLLITEPPWKREYSPTPEEILLATLPDKREIKNPVLLTQRKPKSEKPGWPSKRLLITEPPWKREYSPTPEEILLATLPDKREIINPVLLTQRKPKSEKPGWPSKRLLITEPPWKREYTPTPEEIFLATLPEEKQQQQRWIGNHSLSTWKRNQN